MGGFQKWLLQYIGVVPVEGFCIFLVTLHKTEWPPCSKKIYIPKTTFGTPLGFPTLTRTLGGHGNPNEDLGEP